MVTTLHQVVILAAIVHQYKKIIARIQQVEEEKSIICDAKPMAVDYISFRVLIKSHSWMNNQNQKAADKITFFSFAFNCGLFGLT